MNHAANPHPVSASGGLRWLRWVLPLVILVGASTAGVWYWKTYGTASAGPEGGHGKKTEGAIPVDVAKPRVGGIDRVCTQPGSLEAFEASDIYAKVSGFLESYDEKYDVGQKVKANELIATVLVPEYLTQVKRDEAEVEQRKARVRQAEAHVVAAKADAKAAQGKIVLVQKQLKSKTSYREFREKQYFRIKKLLDDMAIDARLVDEEYDHLEAAIGTEDAGKEAILTTTLEAEASAARIIQAEADLQDAREMVKVADAELAKARVLLSYTEIRSPYDGVITKRAYYKGNFIQSAAAGGEKQQPLFRVETDNKFRMVVQVPDRDVPFVDDGDPAVVTLNAIPNLKIHAKVSRKSRSQDEKTRTMRTEIDVPNTEKKNLASGMYGNCSIILEKGNVNALTVPTSSLIGNAEDGKATIRVARNDKAVLLPVKIGIDNGIEVEILEGINKDDIVIVKANGPLQDGTPVNISNPKSGGSGH